MSELSPSFFTSQLTHFFPCFYGFGDKICTYNPQSAPINFSLGEAVATLGIVFAVFQLADPVWKITLLIKEWYLRHLVWILSGAALLAIFISSLITQISSLSAPFIYPVFWEQIGFLAYILAPISFLIVATRFRNLFNPRRAERFYHILLQKASTGVQKDIEVVITILWSNLNKIMDAAMEFEDRSEGEVISDTDYRRYAISLLNLLLSEKSVADYIVTYRIGFLIALIQQIKEKNLSQRTIGMGFQKLVRRLFENPDSYLYKQLDHQGVTLYAPIYESLFGDSYFIEEFSVLGMWSSYSSGVTEETRMREEYIDVFIEALSTAIKASKFQDSGASQKIANSLYDLNDYAQRLVWQYRTSPNEETRKLMSPIERFLGREFPQMYSEAIQNGTVGKDEKAAKKVSRYRQSLTASYADALVEFLGHIASMDDRKLERNRAMNVLDRILPISSGVDEFDNIRICFFDYLWEEIAENVVRGYFPAIIRVYIQEMYWDAPNMPIWRQLERKKLIEYLNKELKPRIQKDELMANYKDKKETELLPNEITFDRKSGKYFIEFSDKSKKEFQ